MTFVVSDLHLNHDNIIEYCDRPFESVEEMNERLSPTGTIASGPRMRFCTSAISSRSSVATASC